MQIKRKVQVKYLANNESFDNPKVWYSKKQGEIFDTISHHDDDVMGDYFLIKNGQFFGKIRKKDCVVLK